ncbi:MAG: hypothetical protein Q9197_003871 [Variospora fuerteventurae]
MQLVLSFDPSKRKNPAASPLDNCRAIFLIKRPNFSKKRDTPIMDTAEHVATLNRIAAEVRFISVQPSRRSGLDTARPVPNCRYRDDSFILNAKESSPVAGLGKVFAKSRQASRWYRQVRQAAIRFFNALEQSLDQAKAVLENASSLDGRQKLGFRRMGLHVASLGPTLSVMRLKRRALLSDYQALQLRFHRPEAQTTAVAGQEDGRKQPRVFEKLGSGRNALLTDEHLFESWAVDLSEQNKHLQGWLMQRFPFYANF